MTAPALELRIDVSPRDPTLVAGISAPVADPVWMISVQMALGETQAVDGGSPVQARLVRQVAIVSRWLPRAPDGTAGQPIGDGSGAAGAPLETTIENERQPRADEADPHLGAVAGQQYVRLLAGEPSTSLDAYRRALNARYPLGAPVAPDLDDPLLALAASRAIDGQALYRELDAALRGDGAARLPSVPPVAAGDIARVTAAATAFLAWYDARTGAQIPDTNAWLPERFEYQPSIAARTADGEIVLTASQFASGRLDWFDFDVVPGQTLGAGDDAPPPDPVTETFLPAPVRFHGGPGAGHWVFEDASIEIGAIEAGPEDLATMAVVDFAVRYADDHFVVPLVLPAGSLTYVSSLTVYDSFGVDVDIPPVNRPGEPTRLFQHAIAGTADRAAPLLLFPALVSPLESDPIEVVILLRDELGDICWALESKVVGNTGQTIDRGAQLAQRQAAATPTPPPAPGTTPPLRYQLRDRVADNWYPLVAAPGDATCLRVVELEALPGDAPQPVPATRILGELASSVAAIPGEEVTRDGIVVRRTWRVARGHTGTQYAWLTRTAMPAPATARPDLGFDQAVSAGSDDD